MASTPAAATRCSSSSAIWLTRRTSTSSSRRTSFPTSNTRATTSSSWITGRLATAGPIAALKKSHGRVFELRFKVPATPGAISADAFVERILARPAWSAIPADDELLRVFVPGEGGTREIFMLANAAQVQIRHLRPSVPTLEDVFASAVGGA